MSDISPEDVMADVNVCDALRAAMVRVGVYRRLSERDFDWELICLLREVRVNPDGTIAWRSITLGQQLLNCLGEAQNWRCCYCGVPTATTFQSALKDEHRPTFEHVTPTSKGGADHPDNLVMACRRCNSLRGDTDLHAFLRQLTYYRWAWNQPASVSINGQQ